MIDLDNNTVTLKESANQQEQACSASVPLTGTFIPQGKNVKANGHASTSEGSVQPPAGNLPSRYPKNKEVALSQSLLILVLIAVPLSATFHTDANGNFRSVIQKPLPSFAQVSQKKVWQVIFLILQPKLITEWNLPRDLINIKKHLQEWKCLSS